LFTYGTAAGFDNIKVHPHLDLELDKEEEDETVEEDEE
jgi:hypothetical protein